MTRNLKEFVNHTRTNAPDTGIIPEAGTDHVAVLLALYNGAETLPAQLDSLAGQTHRHWSLIVSDDGSRDDWLPIVTGFADRRAPGRTWLMRGPARGFAQNFLALARAAGPLVPYAAFCDQDDAWLPDKLGRAVARLKAVPDDGPALYVSRTLICDRALRPLRPSPRFRQPPGFRNALVQNIGGGNTMVLNRAALDLVQDASPGADGIVAHDWWVYQMVTGAGGTVIYDPEPTVLYRQHGGNLIGAGDRWTSRARRLALLLAGRFRGWNTANATALDRARHWLTPEARATLDLFNAARQGPLRRRIRAMRRAGLYRQTSPGNAALWIAVLANRL